MPLKEGEEKSALGCHSFIHPPLEQGNLIFGPWVVAGHAAVENAGINLFGLSFDMSERRKIKPKVLHGIHVGGVAKQRANVLGEA